MFRKLLVCFAAPALLSGATTAFAANALPSGYTLEYRLADATGNVVQSGRVALSKRNPVQMSTSYVRVSYVASCSPDTGVISNEPKCQLATADIGNTLQLALADATPGTVSLTAWVNRQTLDGMQTIENEGFATQRPLSHGWSDSKTVKVRVGDSVAVPLRDQYTLTLQPARAAE
ncbi:hypothetical protein SAMN05443245_7446 [Paraburkholderia fungorum]|uniref:Uncharacterized protein n=1 Tax=Paraburkholderia fungorum TaxID=134537 RepID=A0A1H1JXL4_9BURK|nr:hypothetical protein [Paraburkholderia fungorum]SDR54520.1 hypothetical protein SAMN05443245_7446 [Paraburkholderia fungorum]